MGLINIDAALEFGKTLSIVRRAQGRLKERMNTSGASVKFVVETAIGDSRLLHTSEVDEVVAPMSYEHSNGTVHFHIAFAWAEIFYANLWVWTRLALRILHHPFEARYRVYYSRTVLFHITAIICFFFFFFLFDHGHYSCFTFYEHSCLSLLLYPTDFTSTLYHLSIIATHKALKLRRFVIAMRHGRAKIENVHRYGWDHGTVDRLYKRCQLTPRKTISLDNEGEEMMAFVDVRLNCDDVSILHIDKTDYNMLLSIPIDARLI
ncbi:hypothetical protein PILCRDRAFT_11555 [Piloderma croceum F 1598]|uniref:Uncharacterized protein n=1 Tax=Piloderma croceum (strain F 1598) TaxID=765440 RepID=A0A0C3FE22_PILCF|nr:hypothetical protein PILCRDRAFT_11555 [Piloderma croceum F 1598]